MEISSDGESEVDDDEEDLESDDDNAALGDQKSDKKGDVEVVAGEEPLEEEEAWHKYSGEWVDGQRHGVGTVHYAPTDMPRYYPHKADSDAASSKQRRGRGRVRGGSKGGDVPPYIVRSHAKYSGQWWRGQPWGEGTWVRFVEVVLPRVAKGTNDGGGSDDDMNGGGSTSTAVAVSDGSASGSTGGGGGGGGSSMVLVWS